jgi:predicted enzyme related to lactoylglutathione lyase
MRVIEKCFRVYTQDIAAAIGFYEALQGITCERRVKIPETGVEAAKVGGFLILAGDEARLDPVRHVDAIFYVDALHDFADWLPAHGAEIIDGPRSVTAGKNLTARHPDGLVVEYFEAAKK